MVIGSHIETILLALVCIALAGLWTRAVFHHEAREREWREIERQLRDQLWELAGGTKPRVKVQHEKILKVPDPEAQPLMNWRDRVWRDDDIVEELEIIHGHQPNTLTPSQAQERYGAEWATIERRLQEEQIPLRKQ